ncbi:MAG: hypothetical protein ABI605_03640 [Rhizobacter sp.]
MDSLWRMAWALPLVLGIGFAAALVLKRFVVTVPSSSPQMQRIRLQESLSLSDDTCVHVIEFDRQAYLLVESSLQTTLQAASVASATSAKAVEAAPMPSRAGPAWALRLLAGGRR